MEQRVPDFDSFNAAILLMFSGSSSASVLTACLTLASGCSGVNSAVMTLVTFLPRS